MANPAPVLILGSIAKAQASARLRQAAGIVMADTPMIVRNLHIDEVSGNDLPEISLDITGTTIADAGDLEAFDGAGERASGALAEAGFEVVEQFDALHAAGGVVQSVTLDANPLSAFGADFTLAGNFTDAPIVWLEGVDGRLAVGIDTEREPLGLEGSALLAVSQQELIDALQSLLSALLEESETPFAVELRQVRLTSVDDRTVKIEASAKASKGILSATAIGEATVAIDTDLVLSVSDVSISSRNPIIAGLLKLVENRLDIEPIALVGSQVVRDLVRDVRIEVGERIEIFVSVG